MSLQTAICRLFEITFAGDALIAALRSRAWGSLRPACVPTFSVLALVLPVLGGCGGSAKPQIASITFTSDASGKTPLCTTAMTPDTPPGTPLCSSALLPVLTAGGPAIYFFANVTNDDQYLGVSWTVTCSSDASAGSGSINTACGIFNPAVTTSGPIPPYTTTGIVTTYNPPSASPKGGTVTISAHATSLPSIASSVTLTIAAAQSAVEPSIHGKNILQTQAADLTEENPTGSNASALRTGHCRAPHSCADRTAL